MRGRRVLVLRPEKQAGDLAERIAARGGQPVVVPSVEILPPLDWTGIDDALARSDSFDWLVFTSVNGVESIFSRIRALQNKSSQITSKVAAIGPATKNALEERGIKVNWMPTRFTTRCIADELPVQGTRVLLVRADVANTDLEDALRGRGFEVSRVDAYRTNPINAEAIREAITSGVDVIALTSSSIVQSLIAAAQDPKLLDGVAVCSIGPATSEACQDAGLEVTVEAEDHTTSGLLEAIERHFGAQG